MLPLRRRPLVLSALVIGAMAPDFEYFVRLTYQGRSWHTMPGLLYTTLPTAFLAFVVFHVLLKWPAISLLPRPWQAKLVGPAGQFRWLPLTQLFWVLVSLVIGIATHILWDGCTHLEGWGVQAWPALQRSVMHVGGSNITVYKLLQQASTVLGLVVLAVCTGKWYRGAPEQEIALPRLSPVKRFAVAVAIVIVALTAGIMKNLRAVPVFYGLGTVQNFLGGFVVTTLTVGTAELLAFSLLWRVFVTRDMARQRQRQPSWR